jgi:protein-L-isoaspartate O-methyltransferase
VGLSHFSQQLRLISKDADGHLQERNVLPVVFVPLVEGVVH